MWSVHVGTFSGGMGIPWRRLAWDHLLSMHGETLNRTQWRDHKAGGQQLSQPLSIFRQTGLCQGTCTWR